MFVGRNFIKGALMKTIGGFSRPILVLGLWTNGERFRPSPFEPCCNRTKDLGLRVSGLGLPV